MKGKDSAGATLIITDFERTRFIMQMKDTGHPVEACHGTLSFFGGNLKPGEKFEEALIRELHEKIPLSALVDRFTSEMYFWRKFRLSRAQFGRGHYHCGVFVVLLEKQFFDVCRNLMMRELKIQEGTTVLVPDHHIDRLHASGQDPAKAFMASQDRVFSAFVRD